MTYKQRTIEFYLDLLKVKQENKQLVQKVIEEVLLDVYEENLNVKEFNV